MAQPKILVRITTTLACLEELQAMWTRLRVRPVPRLISANISWLIFEIRGSAPILAAGQVSPPFLAQTKRRSPCARFAAAA
jgi:hypothetical protein